MSKIEIHMKFLESRVELIQVWIYMLEVLSSCNQLLNGQKNYNCTIDTHHSLMEHIPQLQEGVFGKREVEFILSL